MIRNRFFLTVIIWSLCLPHAVGQSKSAKVFKLPPNAHFIPGKVLVKTKANFKNQINNLVNAKTAGRVNNVSFLSVAPIVKPELARQGSARMAPRNYQPTIDISRYFTIAFEPSRNIEDFINELYATGYFEIVEPDYEAYTDFTPNDPKLGSQYYLNTIRAIQAWDITKGDTAITIAIVDTGGLLTHPDLAANLYTNWAEYPPNGIDDDGNGFIDDYRGWDFIGADTANLTNPNFAGDNNPNNSHTGVLGHATMVAGCASGVTDNGVGIAGVGYKTKIMFTKHTADNQKASAAGIYAGYSGILYAANLGIKIINCSWGGSTKSAILQDLINHVVLDLGSLIVASAGNGGNAAPNYPAAYDNVVSVAATDINDKVGSFSTRNATVDISAPGVSIYTTDGNGYVTVDGTSFSSPITSGAAALVWAHNPGFTAVQVAEQLRVSSDEQALYGANSPSLAHLLGKGRLNIEQALTVHSPALRASNPILTPGPAGKTLLSFDFTNYLESTTGGVQISLSIASNQVTTAKDLISPGVIAGGSTVSNSLNPFELTINPNAAENTSIQVLISYQDGGAYSDSQYLTLIINPSYLDVNSNKINTTVSNIGRLGYQDPNNSALGEGFVFDQQNLLFEMGLIMGNASNNLYNNVRGINGTFDEDFSSTAKITKSTPGQRSYSEISGAFSNSLTPSQQALIVNYQSLVWKDSPYDKFVILEYKINNPTANPISNFYFGIFADWDISPNNDAANWYDAEKLGYVYAAQDPTKPYTGIQLLKGIPGYYAIDNNQAISGNPFGLYDGFTDLEKFLTLSTQRSAAGVSVSGGSDISHVVSSGPHTINAGEVLTVAFALHAAPNFNDLVSSSQWADSVYNFTFNATKPVADSAVVCYGAPATLDASGSTNIKWYAEPVGGASFFTGGQFTTGNIFSDTAFYVSNAENSFESVRTPAVVSVKANPKIGTTGSTTFCDGNSITLSVAKADAILWSTSATTIAINVSSSGTYSVSVTDTTLHCHSSSAPLNVTVNENPVANFSTQGALNTGSPISFADGSTGAVLWSWAFGDGTFSKSQNPQHTFNEGADFDVTLTVTNGFGCQDSETKSISVITGLEDPGAVSFQVYPNPATSSLQVKFSNPYFEEADLSLNNSLGETVFQGKIGYSMNTEEISIPIGTFSTGLYIVRLRLGQKVITKKVIKDH